MTYKEQSQWAKKYRKQAVELAKAAAQANFEGDVDEGLGIGQKWAELQNSLWDAMSKVGIEDSYRKVERMLIADVAVITGWTFASM